MWADAQEPLLIWTKPIMFDIDGLVKDRSISIANALEICQYPDLIMRRRC